MPLVSFITATRDVVRNGRAEALRRCVRSVLTCSFPVEHILVDGGSTDGTIELIQRLGDAEKVAQSESLKWISEKDNGIYDALNKGVKMASGQWICVLGCDDWVCDPQALGEIIGQARADLVITPVDREDDLRTVNMKACLYSIPYCHQGLLARRKVFDRVGGFDARYKLVADYKFALTCLLQNCSHQIVNRKFAHYATGGASSNWGKAFGEGAAIMREMFGLTEEEEARAREKHVLPLRVCLHYLMHQNRYVRRSALYSLVKALVK